jgi:pyruvate ferredoxin oxidoreductase gamma subunit
MKEIRLHGIGGQGTVSGAEMLVAALIAEGKYATVFSLLGVERRGAPVVSFLRLDDAPVRERCQVYEPDCLVVADASLMRVPMVFQGVKLGALLLLNATRLLVEKPHERLGLVGTVDATTIALRELGIPATNTCLLGAFARTTDWVGLDSIRLALRSYFAGEALKKNLRCAELGFEETKVVRFGTGQV